MSPPAAAGRPNQKLRTRKDLLDAAARLNQRGEKPTLEEIAAEALVSRATAYRYFPSTEALMLEAAVHIAVPQPGELFADFPSRDPTARLLRVDEALHATVIANEAPLRLMLAHILERSAVRGASELPERQNRRSDLIAAAVEPAAGEFAPDALEMLSQAVAMLVGTEGLVVAKDVLRLDDASARRVKRWAITALVEAARQEP
jgi:AcrR family transcriptional regulator